MAETKPYDFSGMATVYNVKCNDGRTIGKGAFAHQDGEAVPLVWRHQHDDIDNVLGHVILKAVDNGIRAFAHFNQTDAGRKAKQIVKDRDIRFLSIWANKVKQTAEAIVKHGMIREVSLVFAGANPGAHIDDVVVSHSDDPFESDVVLDGVIIIHSGEEIELFVEEEPMQHEADSETVQDVLNTFNDMQMSVLSVLVAYALGETPKTAGSPSNGQPGQTVAEVWKTFNEKQKAVVYNIVGGVTSDDLAQSDDLGDPIMSNIFEEQSQDAILTHDAMNEMVATARTSKANSLRDVIIAHADTYGIKDIELLFPDAQMVGGNAPAIPARKDMAWVEKVLSATSHSPFSRVKSAYADITADAARARGYVTGAEKFNEVFPVFTRVTTPQTIYKKSKLDRDDIIDVTSFDVVVWLKMEMRLKLREEVARAILIGDGREAISPDKIKEENVRSIYSDHVVYAHRAPYLASDATYLEMVDAIMAAQMDYKGSGEPVLYTTRAIVTNMLLVRDTTNRRIHPTMDTLKAALNVSEIVTVTPMDNVTRLDGLDTIKLIGILVDLRDYTIGADRGGETTFFEDFDIDFNQHKYLLETRISGALTIPKSAVIIEQNLGEL